MHLETYAQRKLIKELRGFHWVMVYGDYVKELEYALRRKGIEPIIIEIE